MFTVETSDNPPDVSWGVLRYDVMLDLAREFAEGNEKYIVVRLHGQVVAMAQIAYKRRLQAFELMTLVSVFPHAGKLAFGRAFSIAKHEGYSMVIFATDHARGFYNALPVCHRISNDTFLAE